MARKKKFWKRLFGDRFNIWDVILLVLLLGSGYYLFANYGVEYLIESTATWIFGSLILGLILNQIVKRANR